MSEQIHRPPHLPGVDYADIGYYFVTFCTKDKEKFFGKIQNGGIQLSQTGRLIDGIWKMIPKQFPTVTLDAHITMPNHVHGIVLIHGKAAMNRDPTKLGSVLVGTNTELAESDTGQTKTNMRLSGGFAGSRNPMGTGSLGEIIRWFKGRSTFESRGTVTELSGVAIHRGQRLGSLWQSRYHEHVIRNFGELDRIRQYIIDNPKNWEKDSFH